MKRKDSNTINFGTINLLIYARTGIGSYGEYDFKNV